MVSISHHFWIHVCHFDMTCNSAFLLQMACEEPLIWISNQSLLFCTVLPKDQEADSAVGATTVTGNIVCLSNSSTKQNRNIILFQFWSARCAYLVALALLCEHTQRWKDDCQHKLHNNKPHHHKMKTTLSEVSFRCRSHGLRMTSTTM